MTTLRERSAAKEHIFQSSAIGTESQQFLTGVDGRWSMVDVYVVTILVALVKLGFLADIEAGPAAIYFAAVVVTTMIAAESFDPRLIWDVVEDKS